MKNDLCHRCQKNKAGEYQDISFVHLGLTVKAFKNDMICVDCAKDKWIEGFEENAKEFISLVDGKPRVDWQRYNKDFGGGKHHNQKEELHYLLVDLGIFSPEAKGNWEIVADGPIGLNPRAFLSYLYFTRKEDVVEFARLEKGYTQYHWEIHRIDEVISKHELVKDKE